MENVALEEEERIIIGGKSRGKNKMSLRWLQMHLSWIAWENGMLMVDGFDVD